MTGLVTSAQMRALESAAIESGLVTGLALMERAGAGVVAAILARWPKVSRATVLCGPGNNGGDGFVVARLLAARGVEVQVLLLGDPARLPPDARANYEAWREVGGVAWRGLDYAPEIADIVQAFARDLAGEWVIVDALFGIGMSRASDAAEGLLRDVCAVAGKADGVGVRRVAVDVPTGLDADTGHVLRGKARAVWPDANRRCDLTVTFQALKPGHVFEAGPELCGALEVVDLGLSVPELTTHIQGPGRSLAKRGGHKFDHGHALVIAGGAGKGGAARLAARAALRVGAGLVTLACPVDALAENAARMDAVMLTTDPVTLMADRRLTAIAIGPGLGFDARAKMLVAAVLQSGRPCVLDADALTLLAQSKELRDLVHADCVLTPHMGEFARLFPSLAAQTQVQEGARAALSRMAAAQKAAGVLHAVVLLKGPTTVIAAPQVPPAFHAALYDRAAPWLATAGAGDVLAGLITGLLARGVPPNEAAGTAAWLHVEAARAFGPGLIAEDLPDALPAVLRGL